MSRRRAARFARLTVLLVLGLAGCEADTGGRATGAPPNVVIIFLDDVGYGDLGTYGHPNIRTPNIDRMAAEGVRLTGFYAASPACSSSVRSAQDLRPWKNANPSRSALEEGPTCLLDSVSHSGWGRRLGNFGWPLQGSCASSLRRAAASEIDRTIGMAERNTHVMMRHVPRARSVRAAFSMLQA